MCMLTCLSRVQLCDPVDYSPPGSFVHGNSQGKNTGLSTYVPSFKTLSSLQKL